MRGTKAAHIAPYSPALKDHRAKGIARLLERKNRTEGGGNLLQLGSAADGFGEGFELARDIGSGGLVRDFGRTLRFERCDAVAPSCAIERESLLRQESPGDEAAIALVDRNQMLIVQCEMAHALGYCVIGCGPGFAVGNSARFAPLEGGVEGDRRAVARSRDGARRTGIFALIEYRA